MGRFRVTQAIVWTSSNSTVGRAFLFLVLPQKRTERRSFGSKKRTRGGPAKYRLFFPRFKIRDVTGEIFATFNRTGSGVALLLGSTNER